MRKAVYAAPENAISHDVWELLEFVMKSRGLSLRGLAEELGTTHQRLARWKDGAENIEEVITLLRKLRKLTGLSWTRFEKAFLEQFNGK